MCDLIKEEKKLESMSQEEFQKRIKEGVASTYEFSKLLLGRPTALIKSDWRILRAEFKKAGISEELTPSQAYELAKFIARKTFED